MKTTKTQAKEIYDNFHGMLRCLNGGTREENKRSAPRCFERLTEISAESVLAVENAGKLVRNDEWLFNALKELPAKAKAFGERYGLGERPEETAVAVNAPPLKCNFLTLIK